MLLVLVIVFSGSSSAAAGGLEQAAAAETSPHSPSSLSRCRSANRAVDFYSRRIAYHVDRSRALVRQISLVSADYSGCPRYLSHVLQRRAYELRRRVDELLAYHYAWWRWMPDKTQRVGACETGYGKRPGRFDWDSGRYVSFAGIYRAGYDDDAHRIGNLGWDETISRLGRLPTPREQMQAVDSHRARWGGWSGWGCRGA